MSQYVTYILLEKRIVWIGPSLKGTFHVLRLVVHPRHRTMKHQRTLRCFPEGTANQQSHDCSEKKSENHGGTDGSFTRI